MTATPESTPRAPITTYRLQFNQDLTFRDALALVPYLDRLGVTDLYASPYLQARPGSVHGYDISRHDRLNPEIGTLQDHAALSSALAERGMGQILDIVPNHMGIGLPANEWWYDVLENGQSSAFASYFDIDWEPLKPELAGKVLLPVLGDQFGRVLENGELRLVHAEGRFRLEYHDHVFPVSPKSTSLVLRGVLERLERRLDDLDEARSEVESIVAALENLPERDRTDPRSVADRRRENRVSRRRVAALFGSSPEFRRALEETVEEFNGRPGHPHSFDLLERLHEDQAYRLAYWRVAAEEINYRRFFDVNDLAGLRMERGEVFQATHQLIFQLIREGKLTGLRVDHPDGLFDPSGYLRDLQAEAASRSGQDPFPVLVEKILTADETLPSTWPVAGTVGYEFLNRLNGLFVAAQNEAAMDDVYAGFIGRRPDLREMIYERKKMVLRVALASELNVLAYLLDRISERNRHFRDFTLGILTDALRETIACFPVYRSYIDARTGRVSDADQRYVEQALRHARRRNRSLSSSGFDFIGDVLLLRWPEDLDAEAREDHARFVMKFQQLTGPVMAKGVEDTAFYVYNRLVSLNEVGGEPAHFGLGPAAFHAWIRRRRDDWPLTMNSTSTHDTKRSEDVRARIDVLSEMPDRWRARVHRWAELNGEHRRESDDEAYPDANDEYLLYQTLLGAWPLEPVRAEARGAFVERVQAYMEKATREAKVHTSWINPNEEYDAALRDFVAAILAEGETPFLRDFRPFQDEIARLGMLNSLSQTAIKLTCPGVPDIYQGQEVWDFSLVDPDNRRPVDYARRARLLEELEARAEAGDRAALARELVDGWKDGRAKLHLTRTALHLRRSDPELFLRGEYVPLAVEGERAEHCIAFARRLDGRAVVVAAPRLWATLLGTHDAPLPDERTWGRTDLAGPAEILGGAFHNPLDGVQVRARTDGDRARLSLREALANFPVAILVRE